MAIFIVVAGSSSCDARRTVTSNEQEYSLAVRVTLPSDLSPVGLALGWPAGVIPGTRVIAERRSLGEPRAAGLRFSRVRAETSCVECGHGAPAP